MLKVWAFGLASGIMWAIVGLWATLVNIWGKGAAPFEWLNAFYLHWLMPTYPGIVLNVAICFVDGFIAGVIFSWLYNKFAK
jgi:hypothetical protein